MEITQNFSASHVINFFINNVIQRHIDTPVGERRISPTPAISGFGTEHRGPAASFRPWTAPVAWQHCVSRGPRPVRPGSAAASKAAGRTT